MSLFDRLGQAGPGQQVPEGKTQQQAVAEIKADPAGVLGRHGLSVPAGMSDPVQIFNHLVNTGQVGGPRLQMVQQLMGRMGRR